MWYGWTSGAFMVQHKDMSIGYYLLYDKWVKTDHLGIKTIYDTMRYGLKLYWNPFSITLTNMNSQSIKTKNKHE